MKSAEELLKRGQLGGAIEAATQNVRTKPADMSARIFLFELLSFAGDLDRAGKQLEVIAHQSSEMKVGVSVYRQLLSAEKTRRAVFEGEEPDFLMNPPEYATFYVDALKCRIQGAATGAWSSLEKGVTMRPRLCGTADGEFFSDFEDADAFLAPFLELYIREKYFWLAYEQIKSIEFQKPLHLRDLLWLRAKLETCGGDLGEVFIPVIYPQMTGEVDDLLRLGRRTDWVDVGEGLTRGVGQRMFLINDIDHAILQVKNLVFRDTSA